MISKTKIILAAATSLLALGTSAALASGPVIVDDVEIYVPPAPTLSWAGAYGGLSVSDVSGDLLENGATTYQLNSTTGFGLFGGYNWQHGNVVFGGEFSYIDFETNFVTAPTATQSNSAEIRARLGYAVDRVMVYGFVGYGRSTLAIPTVSDHLSGAVYGLGVETMFGSNMFGGLEIARRDYSGPFNGAFEELTLDTISLRFGYRF